MCQIKAKGKRNDVACRATARVALQATYHSIIRLYCVVISWKVVYFAVTPFCNCTRTPQ